LEEQALSRMQENKRLPKLDVVRNVTNGICRQHYEECLEQHESGHAAEENVEEQL